MSKTSPRGSDANAQSVRELSQLARPKGVGNTDFNTMHEITVHVAPSFICRAYTEELFDAMQQTVILSTGNPQAVLPFTAPDLFVYMSILLRERIKDVRKERVLFPRGDGDVKIPHFFYLALYELGDVVDEQRHIWLRAEYDYRELEAVHDEWDAAYPLDGEGHVVPNEAMITELERKYSQYRGAGEEREFIYSMSRSLKMLERYGFVNGSALPRGLTGELSFMLFVWMEQKLQHPDPDVEPGQALLASLLAFSRSTTLLNPYISYGPESSYRILLKEVTLPRGRAS